MLSLTLYVLFDWLVRVGLRKVKITPILTCLFKFIMEFIEIVKNTNPRCFSIYRGILIDACLDVLLRLVWFPQGCFQMGCFNTCPLVFPQRLLPQGWFHRVFPHGGASAHTPWSCNMGCFHMGCFHRGAATWGVSTHTPCYVHKGGSTRVVPHGCSHTYPLRCPHGVLPQGVWAWGGVCFPRGCVGGSGEQIHIDVFCGN